MHSLIGRAGLPRNPLSPPHTRLPSFPQGPFGATLRPTLQVQLAGSYPERLFLDFLIRRPDVDGCGGERFAAPGRSPEAVRLERWSASEWAIPYAISFAVPCLAECVALSLFDERDMLVAWGALLEYSKGPTPPSEIAFPSHRIRVKCLR